MSKRKNRKGKGQQDGLETRAEPVRSGTERCCRNCVFGTPLHGRWLRVALSRWPGLMICFHCAEAPGEVHEVHASACCRNFRPRRRPVERIDPPEAPSDDIRFISLTQRQVAIVDAADYEWLSKHRWFVKGKPGKYYAGRSERGKIILVHREIMQPAEGEVVDHINGNSLNNRRSNMRICSQEQNCRNRQPGSNKSGFLGVYPSGRRWKAEIHSGGRAVYRAYFDDKVEAARARDRKARELFGEHASLNLPEEIETGHVKPEAPGAAAEAGRYRRKRYVDCGGSIVFHTSLVATLAVCPAEGQ